MRVVIDGNIASGKSTQIELLKSEYKVLSERIQDWPLDLFYKDQSRWAFLLQFSILKSFSVNKDSYDVFERSPESSRDVFWKMLVTDEIVTHEEDHIYRYFWGLNGWVPDVYIYILTPPEVCFERLTKRHQDGDSIITLGYLQKIHMYYTDYMQQKKIYVIDGTLDPHEINKKIRDILGQCLDNVQV
jgi:deoxyadenosine/deoxycytidine kinase